MSAKEASKDVSSDDRLWAAACYVVFPPLFSILIYFMEEKKERPFIKYHYVQGMIWGLLMWVTFIFVIGLCLSPIYFFGSIYFAYLAYTGEYLEIPLLTNLAKDQGWL